MAQTLVEVRVEVRVEIQVEVEVQVVFSPSFELYRGIKLGKRRARLRQRRTRTGGDV